MPTSFVRSRFPASFDCFPESFRFGQGLVLEGTRLAEAWSAHGQADNFPGDRAILLAEAGIKEEAEAQTTKIRLR